MDDFRVVAEIGFVFILYFHGYFGGEMEEVFEMDVAISYG